MNEQLTTTNEQLPTTNEQLPPDTSWEQEHLERFGTEPNLFDGA